MADAIYKRRILYWIIALAFTVAAYFMSLRISVWILGWFVAARIIAAGGRLNGMENSQQRLFIRVVMWYPVLELILSSLVIFNIFPYTWYLLNRIEHSVLIIALMVLVQPVLYPYLKGKSAIVVFLSLAGFTLLFGICNELFEFVIRIFGNGLREKYVTGYYWDSIYDLAYNIVGLILGYVLFWMDVKGRRLVVRKAAVWVPLIMILYYILTVAAVIVYPKFYGVEKADVAIVLGAAQYNCEASPAFKARIEQGVELYKEGKVKKIVFTGGRVGNGECSEAEVGRQVAMEEYGVCGCDIMIEETSRTTFSNLRESKRIMDSKKYEKALIISDDVHLLRSSIYAFLLDIRYVPVECEDSVYKSWKSKLGFAVKEAAFVSYALVFGGVLD